MSTTTADPTAAGTPRPRPAPVHPLRAILKPVASLQLTVALFALSVGLVFFGTLAQKTAGIWTVVDQYFWSWVVMVDAQPILEFGKIFAWVPKDAQAASWAKFPFPGGKLLGGLMFLNLLAAHGLRFRLHWTRIGIWTAHAGILLLFVGEAITREFQVEQRMTIREGEAVNFTEDHRSAELAFVTPAADGDKVVVVPGSILRDAAKSGAVVSHPELPVDVRVDKYMVNSGLIELKQLKPGDKLPDNPATAGYGKQAAVVEKPEVSGVETTQNIDVPSAYVTLLKKGTQEPLGTYLTTFWYALDAFDRESEPRQSVEAGGVAYDVALRPKRYYKPFQLRLEKFRFDRYVGTNQAKNYSSDLTVLDPDRGPDREVHIAMNEPMRYRGETFFQADFDKRTEAATVLQVVRNPGWLLPYVACTLVSAGLLFHFGLYLTRYLTRHVAAVAKPLAAGPGRLTLAQVAVPVGAAAVAVLFLAGQAAPKANPGKADLSDLARLPVVDGGRVKPLDTVARVYLRKISGREELEADDGKTYPATKWLLDAMSTPVGAAGPAWKHKVIRIDNDQVKELLGLTRREGHRYSLEEIFPRRDLLQAAMDRAKPRPGMSAREDSAAAEVGKFFESGDRDVFAGQVLEVGERVELYTKLLQRGAPMMLPPAEEREWRSYGDVDRQSTQFALFMALQRRGLTFPAYSALADEDRARFEEESQPEREQARLQLIASDPHAMQLVAVFAAHRSGDEKRFAKAVSEFKAATADGTTPAEKAKARFEVFLNEFAPAFQVLKLYLVGLVLTFAGWVALAFNSTAGATLRRAAFWLLVVTFLTHAFALVSRMYLQDRWLVFVTNLYSSAVFIGCAAAGVCLLLECVFKLGLGNAVAAVVGGGTGIIAHNLAAGGDTLEMMQAVLDTNFWLATHVTTVTLGYSATYVAGLFGIVYVVLGVATPLLKERVGGPSETLGKVLGQIIYGVLCLATLLSFVGTVLGGIWADQSWGRFWGWDPKENGAVLIVLWNALILHARWCGLVKDRGTAVLALLGCAVTTWSWFGTNQLGVGLHAYGFNSGLVSLCQGLWAASLALACSGLLPARHWRSFAAR